MSSKRSLSSRHMRQHFFCSLSPVSGRQASFWRQPGRGRGAVRRSVRNPRLTGGETLERKQLLAVDIAIQTPNPGGWITVVADQGSDVFMQMAATEPRSLLIADNASFQPRFEIPNVNALYDDIHVYHGTIVNRSAFSPIYNPNVPAQTFGVPVGYPWLNGDVQERDLFFVMQTEAIDWTEPVVGSLDLNDGTPNDTIFFTNVDLAGNPTVTFRITNGPGVGSQLVYTTGSTGGTRAPQLTFTFDNDQLFGANVGRTGVPVLSLDYDADTDRGVLDIRRVVSQDLGAAVGRPHTFQIFDPLSHQYVPGTLQGTIQLVFGPSTIQSIDFLISSTAVGPNVPIGFGATRGARGDLGGFIWTNEAGGDQGQRIIATGSLNTLTGVLTVEASLSSDGGFNNTAGLQLRPFSTFVSQASVALRDIDPTNNAADPTGLRFDVKANDFTLFPGQTFTRGLIVEMGNPESVVAIESPIVTARAVSLAGTHVNINAPLRTDSRFDIPDKAASSFGTVSEMATVNAIIGSPTVDIRLANDALTSSNRRSRLVVTQTGSISNLANVLTRAPETLPFADEVFVEVIDGDVYIEGRVVAQEQSYLVSSPQMLPDGTSQLGPFPGFVPYNFTTRSRLTGQDVGVLEATTIGITLGNDTIVLPPVPPLSPFMPSTAFAVLDITTNTSAIRVQASDRVNDPLKQPFPYKLTVRETDDLIVDAVAASSLPISIFADGSIDLLALLESAGDVRLQSTEQFVLGAPITTRFGKIELEAPTIIVQNSIRVLDTVQDERLTDILLNATDGPLVMEDAVSGVNRVELRQGGNGGISGANRVFGDIVEITANGSVDVRTAATRVIVRSPSTVSVDELDYGIFEIRDALNVTLVANGFDQILKGGEAGMPEADRAYMSPALYADIYDTQVLTVSAPNGSVDVYHFGANTLTLGDLALIDGGRATRMDASGSVNIRSTLGAIDIYDAPVPTSNARQARLATTGLLGGPNAVYRANSPGVVPSRLDRIRITRTNESGAILAGPAVDASYRFGRELDGVDVTTLRLNDRILVKQGGQGVGDIANGLYTIVDIFYPVGDTSYCEVSLVRSSDADTTGELAQKHYVRVTDGRTLANTVWTADGSTRDLLTEAPQYLGWGDNNEYRFANVFDNEVVNVPVQVTPIQSRSGYVVAKAVTTVALLTGDEAAVYDHNTGTITGTSGNFLIPVINGVELFLGDMVLVRYGADNGAGQVDRRSPGLYVVENIGDGVSSQWELRRYLGEDNDGDGVLDAFFTGRVAVNEGSLRTAVTGEMFEISLNSLGFSDLRYQQVREFTGTGTFDSLLQYRADVGTDNPVADVRFIVSTEAGRNNDTGSFGKMLTLLQANTAINNRTQEPQDQSLSFNATVSNIRLRQELPPIYKEVSIVANRPVAVSGTDIQTSWRGNVVRSGSVTSNVGPLRPTQTMVGRRLYRPGAARSDNQVHGLQLLEGADNSIVGGLTFGGFNNGAAILVRGASNALIQDMTIGRNAAGGVLANKIGIEVQGPGVEHTTIRRSTVLNSTEHGILLGTNSGEVRVVGNTIGAIQQGNKVGITLASQSTTPAYIGAAAGLLSSVLSVRGIVESVDSVTDVAVVRFVEDVNSQRLAGGVTLLESAGGVDRDITAVAFGTHLGADVYRVTLPGASRVNPQSPNRGRLVANGQYEFQVGAMAQSGRYDPVAEAFVSTRSGWMTRGDTEILLPGIVNPGDVFLGQEVSSPRGGFASSTVIEAIRTTPAGTILTLSKPIADTTRGLLVLGRANPNLVVGNSDGIIIDANASRIVNTVVANSIFDGIRVERTDGLSGGVHTLGDSQGKLLGPDGSSFVTSTQNLVIYGNQLSGIRFTSRAFAALGDLTGTNTTPGGVDPERVADYQRIDTYLAEAVRFRGNYIGVDTSAQRPVGNGFTGLENVVVELVSMDPRFEDSGRINFLLLGDTTPLTASGPVSAKLRPNEGLTTDFNGFDSQRNLYGIGGLVTSPPPVNREPTSPRRPIVRG